MSASAVGDETEALRAAIDAYRDLHAAACDDYWSENECACGGRARIAAAEKALARVAGLEAREARLRALAKNARSVAAGPDYDGQTIAAALWAVVDAALADSGEAGS